PLARTILVERQRLKPRHERPDIAWRPPLQPGDPAWQLDYERASYQYDAMVWRVAYYQFGVKAYDGDHLRIDRAFLDFSLDVIRLLPQVYAVVVAHSFTRAVIYASAGRVAMRVPLGLFVLV